ncbi:MAG: cytochrome C [Nitrospiraceae bacterium]|nr:MAG: cytochrome C [Nitrospiraceae bacterium]
MRELKITSVTLPTFTLVLSLLMIFLTPDVYSADIGNCLLCHKYPGLSRVDEKGKLRLLYINEDIFNNSVHAKVKCEGCHLDIQKIPHDPAKKVDCLAECHIKEPSSEQKFSHKDIEKTVAMSVHSKYDKDGKEKKFSEDLPTCKECHDEPLYRPISFFKQVRAGISELSLSRCKSCHKKEDFIYKFYNHVTSRMHRTRNPLNIAESCSRCHDDLQIIKRHNLSAKAAFSYGETFHGKAARFMDERIPDCLDCHVKKGDASHLMLSKENPESAIHEKNKGKICASIDCHPSASPKLAKYGVHSEFSLDRSPAQYYFTVFFIILTGGTLLPLMGIILLDLIRKLFPNAMIRRRK